MSASVRALFAYACISREFTAATGIPAVKSANHPIRLLNRNILTQHVSKSVPSLPPFLFSKPNAPSFGASALVSQTKKNVKYEENGINHGFFSPSSVSEEVAEDLFQKTKNGKTNFNNLSVNGHKYSEGLTTNALYKYAILDKNVQDSLAGQSKDVLKEPRNQDSIAHAPATATVIASPFENGNLNALKAFAHLGLAKESHTEEIKEQQMNEKRPREYASMNPLLKYALL